jgi:hypothetical protein
MRIIFLLTNSSVLKRPSSRPSRAFDTAEGQFDAVGEHTVHEHHSGLDAVGDAERLPPLVARYRFAATSG